MSWEAIGAIAELVGALAVVLTLIYLAIQIRQNTRSMDESRKVEIARNYQQGLQLRNDFIYRFADSEELAAIHVKVEEAGFPENVDSLDLLTPIELRRYKSVQYGNMIANANTQYQFQLGLIDEQSYLRSISVFERMGPSWDRLGIPLLGPRSGA